MIRGSGPGWIVLAALFCSWGQASTVGAQAPGFLQPAAGARLAPGTTVEVAWTLESAARQDFDEMELVLSLDGGRSFPLRVTREVSPAIHRLFWRVPALPAEHARLALRSGKREESESEAIRFVSPEFAIAVLPAESLEELFRVGGEWRTRDAVESAADPPEAGLAELPADQMRAAPAGDREAEPPRTAALAAGDDRQASVSEAPSSPKTASTPRVFARLYTPLRQ